MRQQSFEMRGSHFPAICNASGGVGFYGEGYRFHTLWKFLGLTFKNCGFKAKTTTVPPRLSPEKGLGNIEMQEDGITPKNIFPPCIKADFSNQWVLNAVGLSGPGAEALFKKGLWQKRENPFYLSCMSVAPTVRDRLDELWAYIALAHRYLPKNQHLWAMEINFSCPNVGMDTHALGDEVGQALEIASTLGVPLQPKFNVIVSPEVVKEVCQHFACDAVTIGNTVGWNEIPATIRQKLFGNNPSPLAHFGGGGLSSKEFVPIVCETVKTLRDSGCAKPIIVGNGFYCAADAQRAADAGATGLDVGCRGILRPLGMEQFIRQAHSIFQESADKYLW